MKLNLGCGPLPIHPQHYKVMTNPDEWTLVDLYVNDPQIKNFDATKLEQIEDESCDHIYASHLLEHISHREVPSVLGTWYRRLKHGGLLTINVPDLLWASKQVLKYENGQILDSDVYTSFEGDRGLQSIFYGTHAHEGEYHKAGFTKKSITKLLETIGFEVIDVQNFVDAHDMGIVFVICKK